MKVFGRYRKFPVIALATLISMLLLSASFALGSSGGSESSGGITVMPDWTVGIQIINFLLIIWILNLILYRPIRNIVRQRKEKIDGLELIIETYNSKPIMKIPRKKMRPSQRVSKRLGPKA
jgi:membrane protein implicated in regulation of membrane protease activity